MPDIDEIVQSKLDADTVFQESLADLPDDKKTVAIESKRTELRKKEYSTLAEEKVKNEDLAKNQKARAEKAEGELKEFKEPANKDKDLSSDDVLALVGAQITHPDDIKELKRSAKLLETDIAGVVQDPLVQARLKVLQQERATANASNVRGGGPGPTKVTNAEILERARKGEVFEQGSPEAEQLFWARRGGKK